MSRIHEALKKSERERDHVCAEAATGEGTASQQAAPEIEVPPEARTPTAVAKTERLKGIGVVDPEHLRFEDLQARCAHPRWNPKPGEDVFQAKNGERGAEQFRTLRSRLFQLRNDQPLRTLLVTSSIPREGKTFVVENLAQAIARQPGQRVLVIDADLRRTRLHTLLGAPPTPGLTDYLRGEADEMRVIQCGPEGTCLIPGGTESSNPSELLSNGRIRTLLDRVASAFDWVILDSPPCSPVADASVLAEICDGILLVVRAGLTPFAMVQRTQQKLAGRNVVGVVLNAVEEEEIHGYSSYYQYDSYIVNPSQNSSK